MKCTSKVIIAKYMYADQFTSEDELVGIFTNITDAKKCKGLGCGYIELFEVVLNSQPMILKRIKVK